MGFKGKKCGSSTRKEFNNLNQAVKESESATLRAMRERRWDGGDDESDESAGFAALKVFPQINERACRHTTADSY